MAKTENEEQGFIITSSTCKHYFGFVGHRRSGTAIPEECLTCDKIIECMASKPEKEEAVPPEKKPKVTVAEQVEETVEEVGEKKETELIAELETPVETEKPTIQDSDTHFVVEDAGVLYAQWSGTALISKETLQRWGKKVKEVMISSDKGQRLKLKVQPLEEPENGVVQLPHKVQVNLGVKKGSIVEVKPLAGKSGESPLKFLRKTAANLILRNE